MVLPFKMKVFGVLLPLFAIASAANIRRVGGDFGGNARPNGFDLGQSFEALDFFKAGRGGGLDWNKPGGGFGGNLGSNLDIAGLDFGRNLGFDVGKNGGTRLGSKTQFFPGVTAEDQTEIDPFGTGRIGRKRNMCFFGFCGEQSGGLGFNG